MHLVLDLETSEIRSRQTALPSMYNKLITRQSEVTGLICRVCLDYVFVIEGDRSSDAFDVLSTFPEFDG